MRIQKLEATQYIKPATTTQTAKNSSVLAKPTQVAQTEATRNNTDTFVASSAIPTEEKQTLAEIIEQKNAEIENLKQEMEQSNKQAEALYNQLKTLSKCILIALRISSGDSVPSADYKFLAENEPKMYSTSIQLRVTKEKPIKYKQLSDKDDVSKNDANKPSSENGGDLATFIEKNSNTVPVELDMMLKQ